MNPNTIFFHVNVTPNLNFFSFKYASESDDEALRMAFDRDKTEERKAWIRGFKEDSESEDLDPTDISYQQFVDKELMRFGMVDLRRSIPCLVDGLKPSQRKILWTLLKMDQQGNKEIKVMVQVRSNDNSPFSGLPTRRSRRAEPVLSPRRGIPCQNHRPNGPELLRSRQPPVAPTHRTVRNKT